VTGGSDPALGGVYKLTTVRDAGGEWQDRLKVSEQAAKTTPYEELLVPAYRGGRRVYESPPLNAIQERAAAQLANFHEGTGG
jgi:nicotinate phosphoribosyltransferase